MSINRDALHATFFQSAIFGAPENDGASAGSVSRIASKTQKAKKRCRNNKNKIEKRCIRNLGF